MNPIVEFDIAVLNFIREHISCSFLDAIVPPISFLGNGGWIFILAAVIMLFFRSTRKTGLMTGAALICGLIVCNLALKPLVARIRPFDLVKGIDVIIKKPHDYSFPSGHTTAAFELATVWMMRDRRFGIPALVFAFAMAFTRLYLYVHYPTDVIGGMAVGILCGVAGYFIVDKIWNKVTAKKEASAE